MLGFLESRHAVHVRSAEQASIERVRPGVIGALDRRRMPALLFAHPRSAMPADVDERMQAPLLVTRDDEALTADQRKKVVACVRHLALVPDANPLPRENRALFLREYF